MQHRLRAQRLAFSYDETTPLLSNVDFDLCAGWTGVVGANGAGKSTLFSLIMGALRPTGGTLRIEPAGAAVRLCPQGVDAPTEDIFNFADATDSLSRRLHGRLKLSPWEVHRWPTLSAGERKRWQVGAALSAEPHVLLLDEPTNHLDSQARALLIDALQRYPGVGLLISHDRTLLDALTTRTLRVHGGTITHYAAPYSAAHDAWEAEAAHRRQTRAQLKENAVHLRARLGDARRDLAQTTQQRSTARRMKDKNDSDARGLLANFRVESAEKRIGRNVGVLRDAAERAQDALENFQVEKSFGRAIHVEDARAPVPQLFTLDLPELSVDGNPLLGELHLVVHRNERIRIQGPNGAGKSTLVRALLEHARIPAERILYVPQDLSAEEARTLLDQLHALPSDVRGRVLTIVAALGVDPSRLLATGQPSPGEARKLLMALGLGQQVWCLVLDEPTNTLDLPSVERLQSALSDYPGALLLVSHDPVFAQALTTVCWHVEAGTVDVRHDAS